MILLCASVPQMGVCGSQVSHQCPSPSQQRARRTASGVTPGLRPLLWDCIAELWRASRGCWKATRSAQSLCLLTRDSQGHRREYYLCDASSKQTDNIFFLEECCTQSAGSGHPRAVPLRGRGDRSPTPLLRGEARGGREGSTHARASTSVRMCAHMLQSQSGLFPHDECLVPPLGCQQG